MASPNSNPNPNPNSHQFQSFVDMALFDMKSSDQTLGESSGANASGPIETTISARVLENKQNAKLKKKLLVEEAAAVAHPSPQRFTISLTKEEIEKDLLAMTGKMPLIKGKKKKRSKKEKNDLEVLIPGSSLDGYTAETLKKSYGSFSSKRY